MTENKTLHSKETIDNLTDIPSRENSSRPARRRVKTVNDSDSKTTRPEGEKITGPDGKEYVLRKVEEINTSGYKLSAPTREGYHRVWAIDREPDQLQVMLDLGYRFVPDSRKVRGGSRQDGTSYHHYLMEVPLEVYEARQKESQDAITLRERQIFAPKEGFVTPEGFNSRVERK